MALVVLCSAAPFAGFVAANNYRLVPVGPVIGWWLAWTAVALISLHVVAALTPRADADRLAVAFGAATLAFFSFSKVFDPLRTDPTARLLQTLGWLAGATGLVAVAWWCSRWERVRQFALWFAAFLVAFPVIEVTSYRLSLPSLEAAPVTTLATTPVASEPFAVGSPNVYWLVLDEYARNDQLEALTGYDNAWFYDELAARGFEVSNTSRGSYVRTSQSLTSTLYREHVFAPGRGVANEYQLAGPAVRGDNPTTERFRRAGYRYLYGEAGTLTWARCESPPADSCLSVAGGASSTDELTRNLVESTPLAMLGLGDYRYSDLSALADELEDERGNGVPVFAFVHVMAPHWPYRYDDACGPRPRAIVGNDLAQRERIEHYVNDLRCLNADALAFVDAVVAGDPDAVVLVQSDHGSAFGVDVARPADEWTAEMFDERLAVLSAIRLPSSCAGDDRYPVEGLALVNTFNVVLACLEGRDPVLVPEEVFLSSFDDITDVVDVRELR